MAALEGRVGRTAALEIPLTSTSEQAQPWLSVVLAVWCSPSIALGFHAAHGSNAPQEKIMSRLCSLLPNVEE